MSTLCVGLTWHAGCCCGSRKDGQLAQHGELQRRPTKRALRSAWARAGAEGGPGGKGGMLCTANRPMPQEVPRRVRREAGKVAGGLGGRVNHAGLYPAGGRWRRRRKQMRDEREGVVSRVCLCGCWCQKQDVGERAHLSAYRSCGTRQSGTGL